MSAKKCICGRGCTSDLTRELTALPKTPLLDFLKKERSGQGKKEGKEGEGKGEVGVTWGRLLPGTELRWSINLHTIWADFGYKEKKINLALKNLQKNIYF